jgi:predicted AlkP superfamily phosphohydrolase/phosphomutase
MRPRLVAIALDAADWGLIREWGDQGLLPNLAGLARQGSLHSLENYPWYRNETPWVSLLSGCFPDRTGYWTPLRFHASKYRIRSEGAFSFQLHRPFFALAPGRRVTVFDLPHCGRLFAEVEGVQVVGWGAHSPMGRGRSLPAGLFGSLRRRFGAHPAMRTQNRGSWWDGGRLRRLLGELLEGLARRSAILQALLSEHPADLTLLAFSELHIAGHHFWHLSDRRHPAFGCNQPPLPDFLLEIYRATDRMLGQLLEKISAEDNLLVFSPEGGAGNWCDLNSMVFLPEILFRWNFPCKSLLVDRGEGGEPAAMIARPGFKDWVETVWSEHFANLPPGWVPSWLRPGFSKMAGMPGGNFPFYALRRLGALQWQPAAWYRPWWPQMKAFALPSYGDGCIRINLRGREPGGIVAPAEFEGVRRELGEVLLRLRDPRTGEALVREVVFPAEPRWNIPPGLQPDADILVLWSDQANDMMEEPSLGRLGPVPFWKTGSHRPHGFVIGRGPGIPRRAAAGRSRVIDLAPTVLGLMGCELPPYLPGRPLFE